MAIGAYAGLLMTSPEQFLWGWRWITNTEGLFAACIDEGLGELFPYDDSPELKVVVENDGFKRYLMEYVPNWRALDGKNKQGKIPDQYEHWKRVHELYSLSKVIIVKSTELDAAYDLHRLSDYLSRIGAVAMRQLGENTNASPKDSLGSREDLDSWLNQELQDKKW